METAKSPTPRNRVFKWVLPTTALAVSALVIGGFIIGSNFELDGDKTLIPAMAEHAVVLEDRSKIFVQKYEVSVAEWNRCFDAGDCDLELRVRPGWIPKTTPATGLSFLDIQQYVQWLSDVTGHPFRLPKSSEWMWIAKDVIPDEPDPLFTDPSLTWASAYLVENLPPRSLEATGTFPATSDGIYDLTGSVWEWTQDCYTNAMTAGGCPAYYVAGDHMAVVSLLVRDPARGGCAVGAPPAHLGFRVVSDLVPPG